MSRYDTYYSACNILCVTIHIIYGGVIRGLFMVGQASYGGDARPVVRKVV